MQSQEKRKMEKTNKRDLQNPHFYRDILYVRIHMQNYTEKLEGRKHNGVLISLLLHTITSIMDLQTEIGYNKYIRKEICSDPKCISGRMT